MYISSFDPARTFIVISRFPAFGAGNATEQAFGILVKGRPPLTIIHRHAFFAHVTLTLTHKLDLDILKVYLHIKN